MSDDEYTPTTALVRDGYSPDDAAVRAQYIDGRAWISAISETRLALEFDRWLAAHDAEISEAASQTIEDLTVELVRTRINFVCTRLELEAELATIRAERVAPEAEQVNTYRISYQKYWLTTPGNFASVRDAVEDAFRAGWEAHE